MFEIVKYGNEVLSKKAEEVTVFDASFASFVNGLFETLDASDSGIGLAAPQVGVSKALFVVSLPEEGIRQVFVNPQIVETTVETSPYSEGCLSFPGIYEDVIRPAGVTVQAQDAEGKPFSLKADGIYARVILHEYDHLIGKMFIDRLSETDRQRAVARYEKLNKRKGKKKK